LVVLAVLLTAVSPASAETVVLSAQSVVASPPPVGGFTFTETINQSGLSPGYVSGVTNYATYIGSSPIHTRNNFPPNYAATFTTPPANVDYDLGSTYLIDRLAFWNYPFMSPGGVTSFDVFTSNDPSFASSLLVGTFLPLNDGNGNTNMVQDFDLLNSVGR
jgi:hypothetical protein